VRIFLTKRFSFSACHRFYNKKWSKKKNEKIFGKNINFHGHNYKVDVGVEGEIDKETGMVINIDELKNIVNEVISEFDHKNLNELKYFKEIQPTVENISKIFYEILKEKLPENLKLHKITVYESDFLWASFYGNENELSKKINFYSSHKLLKKNFDKEKNLKIFGKCSNFHGHEYSLILKYRGEVDKETGFLVKREEIEKDVKNVKKLLDYKDLNKIKFLKEKNPTGENILIYLKNKLKNKKISGLTLYETDENIFEMEVN